MPTEKQMARATRNRAITAAITGGATPKDVAKSFGLSVLTVRAIHGIALLGDGAARSQWDSINASVKASKAARKAAWAASDGGRMESLKALKAAERMRRAMEPPPPSSEGDYGRRT